SKKRITKPYYEEFLSTYKDLGGNLMKVPHRDEFLLGAIVGLVRMVACVKRHASPWFQGNWGWVLEDPIVLPEPIEINGQTVFWGLRESERRQLFDQIGEKMLSVERRICAEKLGVHL